MYVTTLTIPQNMEYNTINIPTKKILQWKNIYTKIYQQNKFLWNL